MEQSKDECENIIKLFFHQCEILNQQLQGEIVASRNEMEQ